MFKAVCQKLNIDFDHDAPLKFSSSQWQRSNKCLTYVIYRWLVAIFFIFSFVNSIIFSIQRNQLIVSAIYLTRWNLLFTAITSTMGAYFATLSYNGKFTNQNQMTYGMKIYWALHNNIILFAIIISAIYWMLIFDLFIIQHPYRFSHMIYPMFCGLVYVIFTIIYTFLGGVDKYGENYVYPILNWKEKPISSIIVGTVSIICLGIMHMLICFIHTMRNKLYEYAKSECYCDNVEQNLKYSNVESGN
ncbi:hypothetical protein PVAND_007647 [Polypedilum vanderplanki]|uniref:Uncharacterized protein n=1 Tax=Polypedilum vanderplanki TaxID=319348 RepID=A0A9J6C7L0_POLVA|nr:hypothetical protein PVAND_007647 [Polypedilum vanderplanki]